MAQSINLPCVQGAVEKMIPALQQSLSVSVQWRALGIFFFFKWMLFLICCAFWMIDFLIVLPIQHAAVSKTLTCHCKGRRRVSPLYGANSIHSYAYPVIQTERHWLNFKAYFSSFPSFIVVPGLDFRFTCPCSLFSQIRYQDLLDLKKMNEKKE